MIELPNFIEDEKEVKYQSLKDMGKKLGVPVPETFVTMKVTDAKGDIIHEHSERSHSWVRNAYTLLLCQFASVQPLAGDTTYAAGKIFSKDYTGTVDNYYPRWLGGQETLGYGWRGNASVGTHGIVVGTGDTAETFASYDLATRVLDGVVAGTLSHIAQAAPVKTYNAGTTTWSVPWIRVFQNNSGGAITIKEAGIIAKIYPYYLEELMLRDVLAAPVAVLDAAQLTVTYTVTLQYPA